MQRCYITLNLAASAPRSDDVDRIPFAKGCSGIKWIWWWIVGCHGRQSLSWARWRNSRLFVSEEKLCSIKVITQISQTSSFDRSPPHLPQAVTSPLPRPPCTRLQPSMQSVSTNSCNDNHMTTFACGYVLPASKQRPTRAAEVRYNVGLQTT